MTRTTGLSPPTARLPDPTEAVRAVLWAATGFMEGRDQPLSLVAGTGVPKLRDTSGPVGKGRSAIGWSDSYQGLHNASFGMQKLYTTCSPHAHGRGTEHVTGAGAEA